MAPAPINTLIDRWFLNRLPIRDGMRFWRDQLVPDTRLKISLPDLISFDTILPSQQAAQPALAQVVTL